MDPPFRWGGFYFIYWPPVKVFFWLFFTFSSWEFFFFFSTGLIWARTVFCIDMGNIVFIHMMKIHLPNMYMIFECHTVENKYVALFYNTPKLSTFRIISDSLKLFAPNSLGPFQLLHFLLFFWLWSRSISSHSLLYSNLVWNFLTFFVPRTVMVVKLNQNYLEPSKGAFWYLLRFQIHCQCIRRLD